MSNRLIWNTELVRIARPGVDVFTASYQDLLFTSERGGINIFLEGTVTCPPGNGSFRSGEIVIPYGKTFSGRPHWFFNAGMVSGDWCPLLVGDQTDPSDSESSYGIAYGYLDGRPNRADALVITWSSSKRSAGGVCRYRVIDLDV